VASLREDGLELPWDRTPSLVQAREDLSDPSFVTAVARGERFEFQTHDLGAAARVYADTASRSARPAQRAYALLLAARTLTKAALPQAASAHYRRLLATPLDVVDDQGVPFALYAARRLAKDPQQPDATVYDVLSAVSDATALPPTALYMALDGAAARRDSRGEAIGQRLRARIRDAEELLALRPRLLAVRPPERNRPHTTDWTPVGEPPLAVSVAWRGDALPAVLVALHAIRVLNDLDSVRSCAPPLCRLETVPPARAHADDIAQIGPGVHVALTLAPDAAVPQSAVRRRYYAGAFSAVAALTLLAMYLLWRDLQRELRLAALRSQFVSSVSHELKTPLTAIRMFAETLRLGRPSDPRMREEYLDTIVNESERLTRLLNNVLDFSRIEQQKKTYHQQPHPLADVIGAAVRAVQYPLAQQGFELHLELADSLPIVCVDADAIEQAVLNLLTNAMKYSGDARVIELRAETAGSEVVISVRDGGIGIPAKEQCKIFEKFYRVPTPENRRIPGTGLGLTLVDHIARSHGGFVSVDSAPGSGSTFAVHLPVSAAPVEA